MSGPPLTSKDSGPAGRRPPRSSRPRPRTGAAPLAATAGPDPTTPLGEVRLEVGRLGAPHGLQGHLRLHLTTDEPEHLATLKRVYLDDETAARRIVDVRWHGNDVLIKLAGCATPEAARELTGRRVRIAGTDARPLAPDEFFLYQLIGLRVESPTGEPLGTVTDLLETGANDVLIITPEPPGPPVLVPMIPEFVQAVTPAEGRMIITLPQYLGE